MSAQLDTHVPIPGEAVPTFTAACSTGKAYAIDMDAGKRIVLSFVRTAGDAAGKAVMDGVFEQQHRYDGKNLKFMSVSVDTADQVEQRLATVAPGITHLWDFDQKLSQLYGACQESVRGYKRFTLVLDERLRVIELIPILPDPAQHNARLNAVLDQLAPLSADVPADVDGHAPVLVIPRVFEPEFCRMLIDHYDQIGGKPSGFMRDINGMTHRLLDDKIKIRSDVSISDPKLRQAALHRIYNRLIPEIQKSFQFRATRTERYIVVCYDATTGGYFKPHRDNIAKGAAHRKFAVTINLNTGEYEGGDLRFPEFGQRTYRAPLGGAVVFSCSLLHEATPVTRGKRYAFVPFLYDEEGHRIREANAQFMASQDAESPLSAREGDSAAY